MAKKKLDIDKVDLEQLEKDLGLFMGTVETDFTILCPEKVDVTRLTVFIGLLEKLDKKTFDQIWPLLFTAYSIGGITFKKAYKKEPESRLILAP